MFKDLKQQIAKEKQNGNDKIQTGKTPILFALCGHMNKYFLKENTLEPIFARAFMCLTWNLVCRATNTVTIHLHHLPWTNDCLRVFFFMWKIIRQKIEKGTQDISTQVHMILMAEMQRVTYSQQQVLYKSKDTISIELFKSGTWRFKYNIMWRICWRVLRGDYLSSLLSWSVLLVLMAL